MTFAGAGYVEKYHDMLASNTPASNTARETAPLPDRTPQPTVTGTVTAEEPFGFTPVTSLPSRKGADGQSAKHLRILPKQNLPHRL